MDSWKWEIGVDNEFVVKALRAHLDFHSLPICGGFTRWNKYIPIKVNVFIWRMMLNQLPTRCNLVRRGIDVESMLCMCCNDKQEVVEHLFL